MTVQRLPREAHSSTRIRAMHPSDAAPPYTQSGGKDQAPSDATLLPSIQAALMAAFPNDFRQNFGDIRAIFRYLASGQYTSLAKKFENGTLLATGNEIATNFCWRISVRPGPPIRPEKRHPANFAKRSRNISLIFEKTTPTHTYRITLRAKPSVGTITLEAQTPGENQIITADYHRDRYSIILIHHPSAQAKGVPGGKY